MAENLPVSSSLERRLYFDTCRSIPVDANGSSGSVAADIRIALLTNTGHEFSLSQRVPDASASTVLNEMVLFH